MAWSVADVARMSGTTSRTLRHYDAVGLLRPAYVGGNGYRYYGRDELLRLQQILLLRELGLGLQAIARVLDADEDPVTVLRRHQRLLARERDRLDRLVATVGRTIAALEGGEEMDQHPQEWFTGFDPERQQAYEAEARDRWGDEAVDESRRRMAGWSRADVAEAETEGTAVARAMAALLADGVPADDPRTLDVVAAHYRWVCRFWTPDAQAYAGLGRLYVDDPRFTAHYDAVAPGLATYLSEAMAAYAQARLS